MRFIEFLIEYCPLPMLVLLTLIHGLFWVVVLTYPLTNFDAWWLNVKIMFELCFGSFIVCGIVAVARRAKS
jgi:hypothetical protein